MMKEAFGRVSDDCLTCFDLDVPGIILVPSSLWLCFPLRGFFHPSRLPRRHFEEDSRTLSAFGWVNQAQKDNRSPP